MKASSAVIGALFALSACATTPDAPGDPLLAELAMIAGPTAMHCGPVPLGKDPVPAWRCAQEATRDGISHWFALQLQGIDSDVWVASMLTPSGRHFILSYDSNFKGGPGLLPRFIREACDGTVVFSPASTTQLQCSRK